MRGKFVMLRDPKIPAEQSKPQFQRYTDAELAQIAAAPEHVAKNYAKLADLTWPEDPADLGKFFESLPESTARPTPNRRALTRAPIRWRLLRL